MNKAIKEYHDSAKERNQSEKLAHVLTMREILRMIYKMLSERRLWKYDDPELTDSKLSKLDDD